MDIDDPAAETAEALALTWINGNLSDVRAALEDLEPLAAAALAVQIYQHLAEDGDRFAEILDGWAE